MFLVSELAAKFEMVSCRPSKSKIVQGIVLAFQFSIANPLRITRAISLLMFRTKYSFSKKKVLVF